MVQVKSAPAIETITPKFTISFPQGPTTLSSRAAIGGLDNVAKSEVGRTPILKKEIRKYRINRETNAKIVALPAVDVDFALPDITTAPSMPTKTQTVVYTVCTSGFVGIKRKVHIFSVLKIP